MGELYVGLTNTIVWPESVSSDRSAAFVHVSSLVEEIH